MKSERFVAGSLGVLLGVLLVFPATVEAYVGPGAGFAFVSSFFTLFLALFLGFLTLLTWPLRWLLRSLRGNKVLAKCRVQRVIILGLDGQDPELTDRFIQEGLLPNFVKLREQGSYTRLETTLPAESPVAWSSFQTGCNPGRHRIFDFLEPNRKTYLPQLTSARIEPPRRHLSIGPYRIPLSKPTLSFRRKSQPFWKTLGEYGVFSTVLRVPITFPPEKFNGVMLSAMSVPDLKGTQGTFSYFTSDPREQASFTGGIQVPVEVTNGVVSAAITGPENPVHKSHEEMRIPFQVLVSQNGHDAQLILQKKRYPLKLREFTPWIRVAFSAAPGVKVLGLCHFYLKATAPHFKMYMSPLNIDPQKPALPISHPATYATYLAKTQGDFSTLGLAEDTWALNERVLDEEAFLKQAYRIHLERERMFFDALEKTRRGVVICVFDITDRIQHMFWRYLESEHPANRDKDVKEHKHAIRDLYQKMDDLVGRVLETLDQDTVLMVMSDHGFKSFARGVNLNSWLHQNGYLAVKERPTGREWFEEVDWTRTRAYALGLGGIYLNVEGREARGCVQPGEERERLKAEIIERLGGLHDEELSTAAVGKVYDTSVAYQGPYVEEGPDLVVGFKPGYRVSWTCATGAVTESVFEDNEKSWSGDHCMNPPDVPGIFFCNRKIESSSVNIMDIGPTVLDLFGVPVPAYCDGKPLEVKLPGRDQGSQS